MGGSYKPRSSSPLGQHSKTLSQKKKKLGETEKEKVTLIV
jgi:hypothetical protein